ncbi:MAG TPA: hypothetical protein VMU81_11755 [Acetobacteraceae bacterium]|nr:hypothetical protein [Acetobacteraceae bacterium]
MIDGAARFAARFPIVWHVIEAEGAGPWLATTGLLPAATLLRLAGTPTDLFPSHEGANRDDFQRVAFGDRCEAILRQQIMPDRWLIPTLAGAYTGQPAAWRRVINAHVFFWPDERRRDAFIRACLRLRAQSRTTPAGTPPRVLAFETTALLRQHPRIAFFTRINAGSTVRGGARARRDESTFTLVEKYRGGAVAELAIRGRVMLSAATGLKRVSHSGLRATSLWPDATP